MVMFAMGSTTVKRARRGADAPYYVDDYARSKSRTSYESKNIDLTIGTNGWQVVAPATTSTYPYIWKRTRPYNPNTKIYGLPSYVCITGPTGNTGQPGDPGQPGEKASYYEARFVTQDFNVRVNDNKEEEDGVLYADFDLRVYHIVGSDATPVESSGVSVKFSFRAADGKEVLNRSTTYNSNTKLHSYRNTSLQKPYFGDGVNRITSCYYTISLPSSLGGSTRDGVIPVQFYAPSAFVHSDKLFQSIFADGSQFSQIRQDVNGITTRVQRLEINMLMGTTTALGWTKETTCDKSGYTFDADNRAFLISNYYPKFRDGFKDSSYATLKSPIVRIIRGQKYIVSFRPLSIGDGVNFNVGLRYGTATECVVNDDTKYFAWSDMIKESEGKKEEVIIQSSSDPNRYYIIFEASNNYDYMQVLFVNAIADGEVTSSTTESDTTYINSSWPYLERKEYHMGTDTVTVSDDGSTRTTVAKYAIYTGTDTKYGTVIRTTVEQVVSRNLQVAYLQLEQALYDDINKIIPSPYKESQNAIESYIKQTADSITIHASQIHLEGYTTINKGFSIDEQGNMTANNANIIGGRLEISKGSYSIAIETLKDEPGGIITARNGDQIGIRLGISKPKSDNYKGSSIYTDIASAFASETIAKNIVNGPVLMMGFYHGGGGSTYSFLSSNFFYNQHIDTQYIQAGGLSLTPFTVDDAVGSFNDQPSLAAVDALIIGNKGPAMFPSVLVFKNTYAKTFELGDPNARDSLGLIKNYGRFLFCWHMGGDITFTASVSGKGIRTKSGNGYKDVTSFKSTAKMELVLFYSDGEHWLLTTHNTSMV